MARRFLTSGLVLLPQGIVMGLAAFTLRGPHPRGHATMDMAANDVG